MNINDLYVDLDLVLNKRAKLGSLLSPYEIKQLERKAEKNNWDNSTIIASVYKYIKENITDFLENSDFLDASIVVESDPYIIKAMELMNTSQIDAEVLIVDRNYKYPGCWLNTISEALRGLKCKSQDYVLLMWDAYFMRNYEENSKIPGWAHLADTLEDYYNTL